MICFSVWWPMLFMEDQGSSFSDPDKIGISGDRIYIIRPPLSCTHKENNINWNYKTCILRKISSMVYQQNNLYTLTALYKYVFYVNLKKNGYCYKILRERNKVVNQKSGLPPSLSPYPSPSNASPTFAPMIQGSLVNNMVF